MAPVPSGSDHPGLRLGSAAGLGFPGELRGHSWARTLLDYTWKSKGSWKRLFLSEGCCGDRLFLEQEGG